MANAIGLGTYKSVILRVPFLNLVKRQIAVLGRELGVPFEKTWTCYKGLKKHCGKCGACVERREALDGFDLTDYL